MTPINPTTGSALPYDTVSGSTSNAPDVYAGAYEQPSTNVDASTAYGGGYYDYQVDDPAAGYASAASPVAGAQPSVSTAPTATLDDIAAIGIYTDQELAQIQAMGLTPEGLGELYDATIDYINSPEFAQQYGAGGTGGESVDPGIYADTGDASVDPGIYADTGDASVDPGIYADPATGTATGTAPDAAAAAGAAQGEPGWNDSWNDRFQGTLEDMGMHSQTRMMVVATLREQGLTEDQLQQAFEYYTNTPEGLAELKQVDEQVRAGQPNNAKQLLMLGTGSLIGVGGLVALGKSQKNLTGVLGRIAAKGGNTAEAATAALAKLKAGSAIKPGTELAHDTIRALRTESAATNRLLHPIRKVRLNAAARGLAESSKLSTGDKLRYGLFTKYGDNIDEVVSKASGAAKASKVAGTVADTADAAADVSKAAGTASKAAGTASKVVKGGGDVAKAAGTATKAATAAKVAGEGTEAAMAAAKGAGAVSKMGKALGPIGLVASAGIGIWGISKTMEAEGGFGEESAKMTGNVAGGLAGGVAGAAAGAAIGSVVPVIGTGIGAVVGGLIGGFGGGAIGEGIGSALHGLFS